MTVSAQDRVALITGGGTGVGAATAVTLAVYGNRVAVIFSHSAAKAEKVVAACRADSAEAMAVQRDVSTDADCRRVVETVIDAWSRLDALVNSAGATQFAVLSDLDSQNAEDLFRVYGVNVVGTYQMARVTELHLRRSDAGAIVNILIDHRPQRQWQLHRLHRLDGRAQHADADARAAFPPQVRVNAVL